MQKDEECAGGSSTGSESGFVIVNDSKAPSSVASSFAFISSASSSGTGSHNESPEPQADHEIELQQSTETEAHAEANTDEVANTTSTVSAAVPVPVELPVAPEAEIQLEKPPSPSPSSSQQQQQLSEPPLSKPRSRFVVDVDCASSSSSSVPAPGSSIENQHPVDPLTSQISAGSAGTSKIQPAVANPSRHTHHGRDEASMRDMVRQLRELSESTGMPIRNESGQRLYGPPNNWEGPPPPKGCEVFVGKLPRHIFETVLVPLFARIGPIYQLRMMVDFHGFNRGFCFVQYTQVAHAQQAIYELNDHEIIPSRKIGVVKSVNNTRLFLGGIPTYLDEEQIFREMDKICVDVVRVIICPPLVSKRASSSTATANTSKTTTTDSAPSASNTVPSASNTAMGSNAVASTSSTPGTADSRNQNQGRTRGSPPKNRGYAFVEFASHKSACLARRKMFPKTVRLWGRDIHVDWAVDGTEIRNLHVSNLDPKTTFETIEKLFNSKSQNGVETVKFFRSYTFVHFFSRDQAIAAKTALDGTMVDGRQIQINWAKPSARLDPSFQYYNHQNDNFNNYGYYYGGNQNQNQRVEGGDRRYFQQQNRNWNQNYGYDQSAMYYGRNQGNASNPNSYSRSTPSGGTNFGLLGQFPYPIKQTGSNRTIVPEYHRHRNRANQNSAQDKNKNKNPDAKINPTAKPENPPGDAQRKSPTAPLTSTPKSKCSTSQAQQKPSPLKQPLLPLPPCPPLLPIPVTPTKTASASAARPPLLPLPLPLSLAHPAVQNVHHNFDSPYHPPNHHHHHHHYQKPEQHWQAQRPLLPPPLSMEQFHYPPPQGHYQNQNHQRQHQSPLPYPYLQQQDHYQYPQLGQAQPQSQTRHSSPNVSPTVIIRPTYDGDLPLARTMSELNRDWVSEVEFQNHQQQIQNPQAQGQFQLESQRQVQNHSGPIQDLSNLSRSQGLSEPVYAPFYFPSAHNPNQLIYGCTLYISGTPGGGEIQLTTKYNYGTVEDAKNAVAEETCFDLRRKLTIAQFAQLDLNAAHGHAPNSASSISMQLSAAAPPAPALAIRSRDSGGFFQGQVTQEGMSTNRNSINSRRVAGTGTDTRGGHHSGQTHNKKPFSNWPTAPSTSTTAASATGDRPQEQQREIGSAVYRNQQQQLQPQTVVDTNTNAAHWDGQGAENIRTENEGRRDIQSGNSNANHNQQQLQNNTGVIEAEAGRGGAQRGRNDFRGRGRRGRGGHRGGDSHSGRGHPSRSHDYGRWVNPNSAAQGENNNGGGGNGNEGNNGGGRGGRGRGNPSFSRGRPARR